MRTPLLLAVTGLVSGAAAESITQSVAIAVDSTLGQFGQDVTFDQFDTMNGTRVLTGVTLNYEADLFVEATAQSFFDEPIASGTWSADVFHNVLLAFNDPNGGDGDDDDDGPLPAPFFGLGGILISQFTGDLGPGIPGLGGPFDPGTPGDPITSEFGDSINSTLTSDPFFDSFFTGSGTVDAFIGPFVDILVSPPPAGQISVFASELTQFGTLSLTYEFEVVPAPGALAAIGLGAMMTVRRRR
ncbi:MAG: PEP-CTERM sorting domain-containing protein [Planctomycetota bacterium]